MILGSRALFGFSRIRGRTYQAMLEPPFDISQLVPDYGDPQAEALTCRRECALFDFSFVSRASVTGSGALASIARLTRRPLDHLGSGEIAYALRENDDGILISDLTIWKHDRLRYEVMSGRRQDIADLAEYGHRDADVADLADDTAVFALQGPAALSALDQLADTNKLAELGYFMHCQAEVAGVDCIVGRLGYTGEAGFEFLLRRNQAEAVWQILAERARPAGFAAADILRIEAGFILFSNEFLLPVCASEAGHAQFANPAPVRKTPEFALVGFRARTSQMPVLWQRDKTPGRADVGPGTLIVTSACHSPLAGGTLGLGFARASDIDAARPLVDPHGVFKEIEIVPRPFYDSGKKRPRADWK